MFILMMICSYVMSWKCIVIVLKENSGVVHFIVLFFEVTEG